MLRSGRRACATLNAAGSGLRNPCETHDQRRSAHIGSTRRYTEHDGSATKNCFALRLSGSHRAPIPIDFELEASELVGLVRFSRGARSRPIPARAPPDLPAGRQGAAGEQGWTLTIDTHGAHSRPELSTRHAIAGRSRCCRHCRSPEDLADRSGCRLDGAGFNSSA